MAQRSYPGARGGRCRTPGTCRAAARPGAPRPGARRGAGGRRPGGARPWAAPRAAAGGGRAPSGGGARSLGHPSSACRLPGVSRIAVGVRRRVLPLPPAAPPFLCFLFCFFFSSASAASPPPKNQTVFKNKASERAMARCRVPAPGSVLPAGRERAAVRTGERPPEPPGERSGEEGRFKSGGRNNGKVRQELRRGVEE